MKTVAEKDSSPGAKIGLSMYGVFFGRLTQFLAIPVLALSFVLPVDGMGITVCWIKRWFNLPCPGCGLTRSITCMSQLEFQKAWEYHPFGFVIYPLFVFNVVLLIQNAHAKRRVQTWLHRHDNVVRPTYWGLVILFLIFGGMRILTT